MEENFKIPFRYAEQHHCSASIIHCEDFRFVEEVKQFLAQLNIRSYDLIVAAGGAQAVINCDLANANDIITKSINVSFDLHSADTLIIVNHRDCGAYGGSKIFDNNHDKEMIFHKDQLLQAKNKLAQQYPDKKIMPVYIDIDDKQTTLEFIIL